LEALTAKDPASLSYCNDAIADQMARQALHAATLAQLDCEQREATLLVELALRVGRNAPEGGVAFEFPFTRKEVADFLGLNPHTLSRIMSRLRGTGVVTQTERGETVVRDLPALAARSPAAQSLFEMGGGSRPHASLGARL
jgi:CRP/FNR family transcriptional regulator